MANQQLVDYIRQQLAAGVEKDTIVQTLTETGWASSDILSAVLASVGTISSSTPPSPTSPQGIPVSNATPIEATSSDVSTVGMLLLTGIFSIMGVFLAVLFKFVGVFPASWSWGAVLGGLIVFLFILFLAGKFLGGVAVIIICSIMIPIGGFYLVFGIPMLQHAAQQNALKNGVVGTAVVTTATFDGFINYQGEFTLTLEVTPQSGAPFSATTMVFGGGSSQHSPYPAGTKVNVKYVPTNHDVVITGSSL